MTLKITRYKLIKEYPDSPKIGYIQKYNSDLSYYPEFWEPVYEEDCKEDYKVGDWITAIDVKVL